MVEILYKGKGERVVLGFYMNPGELRFVTEKQAQQLVDADPKSFEILKPKSGKKTKTESKQPELSADGEMPTGEGG